MIDWEDVALHLGAGIAIVGVVALFGVWGAAVVNAIFWPGREAFQRVQRGNPWWRWRLQPHLEAWPPAIAGLVIAALT